MGCVPLACRSAEVWADNFNDGTYEPEWTVVVNPELYGGDFGFNGSEWSAANGYLQMIQSSTSWGVIEHFSDVVSGSWSFDIQLNLTQVPPGRIVAVNFIGNDLHNLNDENETESYMIQFRTVGSAPDYDIILRLWRIIRGNDFPINISEAIPAAGWHHIDVTRTVTGLFSLYLN